MQTAVTESLLPESERAPVSSRVLTDPSERLPIATKLAFGAPSFAGAAMAIPIAIHMPKFYADVVLVPLGYLALAIAAARAFDAITDPIMGWISDRTKSRWGRRRPWIAFGVPCCAVAFYCLFSPPASLNPTEAATWFLFTFVAHFLFSTVYEIPHYGLGAELTFDYHERSSLFGFRSAFIIAGTVVAVLLPGFLEMGGLGDPRQVFRWMATGYAVLLIALYAVLLAKVRERAELMSKASNPLVPGVRRALRSRPFRILLLTYTIASIPAAIPGTLMPFYTQYVIQPEKPGLWLMIFLATYFISGLAFLPIWIRVARHSSKLTVWLSCFIIGISGGASLFFMGPGDEWLVFALLIYTGSQFGAGFFVGPAMQADVIDYDELRTGKRREAQHGAFWAIVTKLVVIPSAAIPIAILGAMGYVPNQPQTPEVVYAIKAIFALTPAAFSLIAFFIAWQYPVTESVHRRIREGIIQLALGRTAVDPLTGRVVSPAKMRVVDEDTGWFLDHFSAGELRRVVERGPWRLRWEVTGWLVASLGAWVLAVLFVASQASLESEPGAAAVIGVVAAGFCLTAFFFHLCRLGPALRLRRNPLPTDVLCAHLAEITGA